jgi:hypothetical protein
MRGQVETDARGTFPGEDLFDNPYRWSMDCRFAAGVGSGVGSGTRAVRGRRTGQPALCPAHAGTVEFLRLDRTKSSRTATLFRESVAPILTQANVLAVLIKCPRSHLVGSRDTFGEQI